MEQGDNRNALMGLVFLKFAGDKFEARRKEYGDNQIFLNKPSLYLAFYLGENVFYLEETSRWSYITEHASDNKIANILELAMADIENITKDAKHIKEVDMNFILRTLDHIKVYETERIIIRFMDGTEMECNGE